MEISFNFKEITLAMIATTIRKIKLGNSFDNLFNELNLKI
tara:strand:+ start:1855 stop:1974 length:120 start_codon:yes stop_codon:yes gene_type:complete